MNRSVYNQGFAAMLNVFQEMIEDAETSPPVKWDDEYAEHAVDDALDRLICAGPMKPDDELHARYVELRKRAAPYLDEGVELPATQADFDRGAQVFRKLAEMHETPLPKPLTEYREAMVAAERLIEEINAMKEPVRIAVVAGFGGLAQDRVQAAELSLRDDMGILRVILNVKLKPQDVKVEFALHRPDVG